MKYHSTIKRDDTYYNMNEPWNIQMKETGHKIPHFVWFYLYEMSRIGKIRDRNWISACQGMGDGDWLIRDRSLSGDNNVLEIDSGVR